MTSQSKSSGRHFLCILQHQNSSLCGKELSQENSILHKNLRILRITFFFFKINKKTFLKKNNTYPHFFNPLLDNKILDWSKLKEFADKNFKFDESGRKLSKRAENTGKRRNCSLGAISPFPTVFSKGLFPRGVNRCHCVGMG